MPETFFFRVFCVQASLEGFSSWHLKGYVSYVMMVMLVLMVILLQMKVMKIQVQINGGMLLITGTYTAKLSQRTKAIFLFCSFRRCEDDYGWDGIKIQ